LSCLIIAMGLVVNVSSAGFSRPLLCSDRSVVLQRRNQLPRHQLGSGYRRPAANRSRYSKLVPDRMRPKVTWRDDLPESAAVGGPPSHRRSTDEVALRERKSTRLNSSSV